MEQDLKTLARTLVNVANTVMALAASLYFVLDAVLPERQAGETGPLLRDRFPSPTLLALIGGALLILNMVRVIYWRASRTREYDGPLLSHTDEGVVQVSREAIEAGLRTAGEALEEVTRLRVKISTPHKRKVIVRALYLAPEGVQILDLSTRLRRVLAERFHHMVRMDRESKLEIEILFEGFYGKPLPQAATPPEEPEPQAPVPPFTGPRYPVEPGEETV